MTKQTQQQPIQKNYDELILVVKRSDLFAHQPAWSGLKTVNFEDYLSIIQTKKEFHPRSIMETDPAYKQIIPYLIFNFEDKYFLMQRAGDATETRLKNKYTLGIGGHVRQEDLSTESIIDWARREFDEEINFNGTYTIHPLGILNDDSNPVGQVHLGFVMLLKGSSDAISIKSELKNGTLLTLEECKQFFNNMETWSQIAFEALTKQQ